MWHPQHEMIASSDRLALVIDDERMTYRELVAGVERTRRDLEALGVVPGARIGLLLPTSSASIRLLLAAWQVGAVVVPLNLRYRSHELRYIIPHSDIEILFVDASAEALVGSYGRVREAFPAITLQANPLDLRLDDAPALRAIVSVGDAPAPAELVGEATLTDVAARGRTGSYKATDEQLVVYTSGTTAHPKGCVHSLTHFLQTARYTADTMQLRRDGVLWDPLPLFHTGGLLPMLGALERGATYISGSHFDAGRGLRLIANERVTAGYVAFPTLVTALLDHPTFPVTDVSSLRWILAIGPPQLLKRVQVAFSAATQVSCYGSTETGGVVVYNDVSADAETRAATSGTPFPGVEIRVVEPETATEIGPNQSGEIEVRGGSVLRRYHRDPVSVLRAGGWFPTGDRGSLDSVGCLTFTGRIKDMFKVGGENVAAAEVESVLALHPAVTLAQAVSIPDDRLVEVVVAFVELRPGARASAAELIEFCRGQLASFKVPRYVRIVNEWPMSATKIQKFRLREQLMVELELAPDGPLAASAAGGPESSGSA